MTRTFTSEANFPALLKEDFATANYTIYGIPLITARIHDAVHTNLGSSASSDDLALAGTAAVYLTSGDVMNSSVTRRARVITAIPSQYVDGDPIRVTVYAKILDAAAAASATVDVEAYIEDDTGTATSDICTQVAQSCNSTTVAGYNFTLNPATAVAGKRLNIRLSLIIDDTGGGDACTGAIVGVYLQCNTKGT